MSIIVVFYSRYSQQSLQFLEKIEKIMEVRKLCVDNENVRNKVITEKENYQIEYVPTTLIFHPEGVMEKYAGFSTCMEWLEKVTPTPEQIKNTSTIQSPIQEVKPISEKIPIENIEFEPRKVDTSPLIEKSKKISDSNDSDVEEKIKEDRESQAQSNLKKNNQNDSILSIAQQMQKQRETEVSD